MPLKFFSTYTKIIYLFLLIPIKFSNFCNDFIFPDGMIMLGKGGNSSPVLQWKDPTMIYPQYLSFLVNRETNEEPEASEYADVQYGLGPEYTISSQDCTGK